MVDEVIRFSPGGTQEVVSGPPQYDHMVVPREKVKLVKGIEQKGRFLDSSSSKTLYIFWLFPPF